MFNRAGRGRPQKWSAIKMTLYRSPRDSPDRRFGSSTLQEPRQASRVLVELKARFDEAPTSNGRGPEDAGVHVGLWIVGPEDGTPRRRWCCAQKEIRRPRYRPYRTGNYNGKTARTYEDFGLLTCDPAITRRTWASSSTSSPAFLAYWQVQEDHGESAVDAHEVIELINLQRDRGRSVGSP